jgi:broad specificity phosphatase PhoE
LLIDSKLCDEGIEQCTTAGRHLHPYEFNSIVVSPMRRTLETAYWIFKDHPCWSQMEVTLLPDLREKLTIVGDIPLPNELYVNELNSIY